MPSATYGEICGRRSQFLGQQQNRPENHIQLEEHWPWKLQTCRKQVHHLIRRFEELRKKTARLLANLTFLCRCRDHRRMSKYFQLRHTFRSAAAKRIYKRASLALLGEQIQDTYKQLNTTKQQLYEMHLCLKSLMDNSLWKNLNRLEGRTSRKQPSTLDRLSIAVWLPSHLPLSPFLSKKTTLEFRKLYPTKKELPTLKDPYEK